MDATNQIQVSPVAVALSAPPRAAASSPKLGAAAHPSKRSKEGATGRAWTPADKKLIADMREKRISHEVIAKVFGVTSQRISALALRWGLPMIGHTNNRKEYIKQTVFKPENDPSIPRETKTRKCSMCSKPFTSLHRHNFVCQPCKSTEAWRSGI